MLGLRCEMAMTAGSKEPQTVHLLNLSSWCSLMISSKIVLSANFFPYQKLHSRLYRQCVQYKIIINLVLHDGGASTMMVWITHHISLVLLVLYLSPVSADFYALSLWCKLSVSLWHFFVIITSWIYFLLYVVTVDVNSPRRFDPFNQPVDCRRSSTIW